MGLLGRGGERRLTEVEMATMGVKTSTNVAKPTMPAAEKVAPRDRPRGLARSILGAGPLES